MSIEQQIAAAVAAAVQDDLHALRDEIADLRAELAEPKPEQRLTRKELATVWRVSMRHVDNLRREGMPCILVGESPRFLLSAVEPWLRGRR